MNQFIDKSEGGPDVLKAQVFLAEIYYQDQNFDQTMTLVEEVLAINSKDLAAHTIKGNVLLARKDFLGAISEYRTVLQEKPKDIGVLLNLAKAHFLNDELEIATDNFKIVLDINPNIKEALLFLGDMALKKKNVRSADEYYSRLLNLDPEAALPNYKVGLTRLLENKGTEALPYFEKALAADNNYISALAQIAYASIRGGDLDAAVARVRKQIDVNPQNPDFYVLLGRIYAIGKDFSKARASFEEAFKIDPDNEHALFNLAQLEQSQGSIDEALEHYEKISAKNPDNSFISLIIAMLLETKGETVKAKEIYEQVLVTNPENLIAVNNLAFYLAEHAPTPENLAKAEGLILPFMDKLKGNLSLTDTIAWIYYRKGQYEKARDLLLASQEDVSIPAINYHLGMIFSRLDEKERAKKYLQVALETQSAFPGREDAESELKKLSQ
ncbi:MAG: tetratricopeptide repeat protein [Deltaproteobacteria bacterium]|nr:tetratricopeptide repeat protein [Deltaproteobacteria bacterium]